MTEHFDDNSHENDINNIAPSFAELEIEEYDEEDELIRQNVQELWEFWQKKACTCRKSKKKNKSCFEKIGFRQFFKRQEECRNMSHNVLDTWIKGQLASFAYHELQENEVQSRIKYQYRYNNKLVTCLPTYLTLVGISSSRLDRIKAHMKSYGMEEIIHGNTGRSSIRPNRAIIDDQIKQEISKYLNNYADLYGFPSPGRSLRNNSTPVVSLPRDKTYTSVYEEYVINVQSNKDEDYRILAYRSFYRIWKEVAPHIRFMTQASDLCDKCEQLRAKIRVTNDIENKQKLQAEYDLHRAAATVERQYYNENINISKQPMSNVIHICYDWAQNVPIPHLPRQPGGLFFRSLFNVHVFGVANTSLMTQRNYLIGEHQLPMKTPKGANTTLNLVYNSLLNWNPTQTYLKITCDNCGGQNKNNLTLWFYSWLTTIKFFDIIELNFMIPGHTKFICDSYFGIIKSQYHKHNVMSMDHVETIVNRSKKDGSNVAVRYDNNDQIGWNYYDFETFLSPYFIKYDGIRAFRHFYFYHDKPGKVFMSLEANGLKTEAKIRNNINFDPYKPLDIIPLKPLSLKRQAYLFKEVRPYIHDPYKDELCFAPNEHDSKKH